MEAQLHQWNIPVLAVALVVASCAAPSSTQDPPQHSEPAAEMAPPSRGEGASPLALPLCEEFTTAVPVDGPLSEDPEVAAAQEYRARHGFPSDIASTLAAMERSSEPASSESAEDIPYLTPKEDREIQARNELDVEPAVSYGAQHPEQYGGLWLDQRAGGVVTVAFTDRLEVHEAALADLMGETPFRVVRVDHSLAELEREQDRAIAALKEWGESSFAVGAHNRLNRVTLSIGYLDPEEVAFLAERLNPEKVCLEGTLQPPAEPEPQVRSEPGWRLLAEETEGRPYTVSVALGPGSLERMWSYFGLVGALPAVHFEREVVLLFTQAVSGSCPEIRFEGLVVEGNRVYGTFSYPRGDQVVCTDDANPHSYVLAVERRVLPDRFLLQLEEGDACPGCEEDSLYVDLTDPGLEERLWGFGRLLVLKEGETGSAAPAIFLLTTLPSGDVVFDAVDSLAGEPTYLRVIEPADGSYQLAAWAGPCPQGACGDAPLTEAPEGACTMEVEVLPGSDLWAIVSFEGDHCNWRIDDRPPPGI